MNKSITKERHMIREYRDSDAQTVRDVFTETHLAEAELMPEYLRQEYRTAVADEVGVKLTNVREGYAALPNRLFIASKADDPGEITGFCALVKVDETTAGLKNVVVSPRHQGQGIARLLMEAFEEHARGDGYRRATLWTYSNLKVAMGMYRRRGWTDVPIELKPDMITGLEPVAMELQLR